MMYDHSPPQSPSFLGHAVLVGDLTIANKFWQSLVTSLYQGSTVPLRGGRGVLPYESDGVLVEPLRGLYLWIGTAYVLKPKMTAARVVSVRLRGLR